MAKKIARKKAKHFDADTLDSVTAGHVAQFPAEQHERHAKKHGKKHAKKHAKKKHPGPHHEPPHERMLAEIRAIRDLLDKRARKRSHEDEPPHERVLAELRELRRELERDE
jgi:hypothetical protein